MAAKDVPVPVIHLVSTWYQSINSQTRESQLVPANSVNIYVFAVVVLLLLL